MNHKYYNILSLYITLTPQLNEADETSISDNKLES